MSYDIRKFSSLGHDFTTYQIWSKESGASYADARREENPFSVNRELSLQHAAMLQEHAARGKDPRYSRKYYVFEVHDMVRQIN